MTEKIATNTPTVAQEQQNQSRDQLAREATDQPAKVPEAGRRTEKEVPVSSEQLEGNLDHEVLEVDHRCRYQRKRRNLEVYSEEIIISDADDHHPELIQLGYLHDQESLESLVSIQNTTVRTTL